MFAQLFDLLPAGLLPRLGIGACVFAVGAGVGLWAGVRLGDGEVADCRQEFAEYRETLARQSSEALAALATRFADAEQRYEVERDRKQRERTRTVTEIRHEIRELPVRDCSLTPAAHRLLARAHCAAGDRADADPECVSEGVRGAGDPAQGRQ